MQYRARPDVDTCYVAEDRSTSANLEGLRSRRADRILDGNVVAPHDLETANPNLVGGDRVGGSHRLLPECPLPRTAVSATVTSAATRRRR